MESMSYKSRLRQSQRDRATAIVNREMSGMRRSAIENKEARGRPESLEVRDWVTLWKSWSKCKRFGTSPGVSVTACAQRVVRGMGLTRGNYSKFGCVWLLARELPHGECASPQVGTIKTNWGTLE